MTRRRFVRQAGTAAATFAAATTTISRRAFAAEVDPIEVAFVGLGERGGQLLETFVATGRIRVAWLCDVHQAAIDSAQRLAARQGRPPRTTSDFRHVLEDRRTQAVVLATPDHWHATAALLALKAGKAVYLEPPLAHNPREGELLVEGARRTRGIIDVGFQHRGIPWVREIVDRLRAREFGPVHFTRAWHTDQRGSIGFGQLAPVPAGFDYDLWQGPAPDRPFRDNLLPRNWRWFWNWGTGESGLHGVHYLDIARWALDLDCPLRVGSAGGRYHFVDDQETPDTQTVTYDFGRQTVVWEHRSCVPQPVEGEPSGIEFVGEKASVIIGRVGYRILDPRGREIRRVEGEDTVSASHAVGAFLSRILRRGTDPAAGVEDAHKSTLLVHVGNIAHRIGHSVALNPETRQVRDDREAAALWHRAYRNGWEPVVP